MNAHLAPIPRLCLLILLLISPLPSAIGGPATLAEATRLVRAVDSGAKGHADAIEAVSFLSGLGVEVIPDLLVSMDGANPLAANWLRSVVESISQKGTREGRPVPVGKLGEFLLDVRHSPSARQLAFELLSESATNAASSLLPGMLNDPSMTLRRAAVQQLLEQALLRQTNSQPAAATLLFQQALGAARDVDQIELITARLKDLGYKTDLARLFGWVRSWKVIGPFDNSKRSGFDQVFPPEKEIQLNAEYDGKEGRVKWMDLQSADDYGKIDVNLPLGKLKETIAYCYTELHADRAQLAELRLGCKNAWKVWVNGKLLFGRDEYHRGAEIDQYRLPAELKAGRNTVLVKLGQNEQKEEWTVEWEFQLRVTDASGTPITPLRVGVPQPTTASN